MLMNRGNIDVHHQDRRWNWTSFHTGSQDRHQDIPQLVLDHSIDADAPKRDRRTSVASGVKNGRAPVVPLLLEPAVEIHGLDVISSGKARWT
jgi:hypothetical protein